MSESHVPDVEAVGEGSEEPVAPASAIPAEPQCDISKAPGAEPLAEAAVDYRALCAERTEDLQRLQAEYINYKKRVDRDRSLARQAGVAAVLQDLLPVFDAIELAQQHDGLAQGGKMIIAEFEKVAGKHGLIAFGEVGELFDPARHEALMQAPYDEPVKVVTVSQVIQRGYELDGRVLRPARVAVANP